MLKRRLSTNYLINKLDKEYRKGIKDFGIICKYLNKFSFRGAIRNAVKWYNGELCRRFREVYYRRRIDFYCYSNKNIPDFLFHGTTSKFYYDILEEGLLPYGKEQKVYLTDNIFAAYFYGIWKVNKKGGMNSYPVIFIVYAKDLKEKLEAEPEFFTTVNFNSMRLAVIPHMQFTYPIKIKTIGNFIPPSYCKNLSMLISILENVPDLTFEEQKEIEYLQYLFNKHCTSCTSK